MKYLIEPLLLNGYLNEKANLIIADVRWYLTAPEKAEMEWKKEHIPGAVFINLDNDLSDKSDINSGRHPLPEPDIFVKKIAEKGIGKDSLIVAYDDAGGAIAARLWWMMRWINGPEVKILDGGWQAWKGLDLPTESGSDIRIINPAKNPIIPDVQKHLLVRKEDVLDETTNKKSIIVDARDEERFSGKVEPIDPVAGHIPGAINYPYKNNLGSSNKFKNHELIKENLENLGIKPGKDIISYCGSGVTACHNILAMEMSGIHGVKLYPGSWSEWSRDSNLKVEKTDDKS